MKRVFTFVLAAVVICPLIAARTAAANPGKSTLATIAGSVNDSKGNPVAGALVSLLKEGAKEAVKHIRTDKAGKFSTKIAPGRYGIRAIAEGFNEVIFSSFEVRASQELIYRFNLEPAGLGKTLPEQRKDRDDVRWTLRSSQTRRSIFQVQEQDANDIHAVLGIENASVEGPTETESGVRINSFDRRPQGVVETYHASNAFGLSYTGLNFAVAAPATEDIDLVFAGQTGVGAGAPGRFEATGKVRAGDRHKVNLSVAGMRFALPVRTISNNETAVNGQFSVRAIDEWIVRDGVVIVLGLDYSRFIGGGGDHVLSPRIGIQFDATARTRLRVAYAPGGSEDEVQSFASFEDAQVVFSGENSKPIAYIDGEAVMERTHRLEFGVERVLDNYSSIEATAFFDTTSGRGVGFLSIPLSPLSPTTGENLISVANQQGAARGMRVVYTRRLTRVWTASGAYSFGQGQQLNTAAIEHPGEVFTGGFFHSAAFQLGAGFNTGTRVRTVLRFSPQATVFAIDPFAGRLGVYDPSLSIQVTQDLPSFGLPLRAEAVIDARNLLDTQASTEGNEILTQLSTGRRSVRGGIAFRF